MSEATAKAITTGEPWGGLKDVELGDPKRVKWVLERVDNLKKIVDTAYVELSELLWEVKDKQYWKKSGCRDFEEYCDKKLQFKDRKGWYFCSIYQNLVKDAKVSKEDLAKVEWTLAAQVASLPKEAMKDGTAKKLLKEAQTMSRLELMAEVRKLKNSYSDDPKKKKMSEIVTVHEEFYLQPDQKKNVDSALHLARKIMQKMNKPVGDLTKAHFLDMICLEFNASRMEEGDVKLNWMLTQIERIFGVECVAIQVKGKNEVVVHGNKVAKKYGIE